MIRHFSLIERARELPTPSIDFSGRWQDGLGSVMNLTVKDRILSGTYRAAFYRDNNYEDFDLRGFVRGDLISFAVDFGRHGSLSSFAGQHLSPSGTSVIKMVWLLTENVVDADNGSELVGAVLTGSSEFRRQL